MADFDLAIVDTGGLYVDTWLDPTVAGKPSRLNPTPAIPHRYFRFQYGAGIIWTLGCIVGGVDRPLDSALGGRLFTWSWFDIPSIYYAPPVITPTASKSSELTFPAGTFGAKVGHWTICATREDGGAIGISWEVVS
jgi:hypothetical protein